MTIDSAPGRALSRDKTYARRAESVLRDMILDGKMAPGERVNEVALASELGISRGPLREATQRLASAGLLTVVSHRGAFVRTFGRREIVELYEVRIALETYAVRLVCKRATEADIAGFGAMLEETQNDMNKRSNQAYPRQHDLHLRLMTVAGNHTLITQGQAVYNQLSLARAMSSNRPRRAHAAVDEHSALIRAIERRSEVEAAQLLESHLTHSMNSALEALSLSSDSPEHVNS